MILKMNLKSSLKEKNKVLGCWNIIPSPSVSEIIGLAGFDFQIIDMEHGGITFETAENMIRSIEISNSSSLLRVPTNDASFIQRALETGVHGIVVPNISSAQEAEQAVKACKYFPDGTRGFSPFTRSGRYVSDNATELAKVKNEETVVVLLVEGTKGLNNLPDILKVPNIDVIYLGLYDISQSLGHPGNLDHPKVIEYIEHYVKLISGAGLTPGTIAINDSKLEWLISLGFDFIAYQADCSILSNATNRIAQQFKTLSSTQT